MASTYFGLLAEFGAAEIRLEDCCQKYFGLNKQEAYRAATMCRLPIAVYRVGSRKSPWMISISDLADYIDKQRAEAWEDWYNVRS